VATERQTIDAKLMAVALILARKGLGATSPNPAVGAVLARGERVMARGYHRRAGAPHAEVDCLRKVPDARGATLYVTLEPCSTSGRTPPCLDYIVRRGVRRVVIGATDPNPQHQGRALDLLEAAGIEVTTGVLEQECARLNEAFNKWIVTQQPFVIAKCAMSLDGRLTRRRGEPRWLTSAAARRHAMRLRAQVDAILVGAETVRRDNPRLTVRHIPGRAKQPWRAVLTRSGRLPRSARVFSDAHKDRTVIFRDQPLSEVLRELGRREVLSVLIEGGGEILSEALDGRFIDKFQTYVAPRISGGGVLAYGGNGAASAGDAVRLSGVTYERIGSDVCLTGYANYP
jgi:diaminohydroxyphosphoribosylaminopyrimidine deaminase / 5-amino-6-(5-phosphoribosylamino)uracil reductase